MTIWGKLQGGILEANGNGGDGKVNGGTIGAIYRIFKDFGFPVVVAGALFYALLCKDAQVAAMSDKVTAALENNTRALTELTVIVRGGGR